MVSASRIVDNLWAMTTPVRPVRRPAMARWVRTSVRVSTDDVASSRTRIDGWMRTARASEQLAFARAEASF
ncbi:hypothetical protein AQJ30_06855 [Streptomyces longwoodensis]|uniref:Uncharacterized protein n=1 Tax=Streptomyces longwoodensis TaxID=68231 RepID=A0A101R298_9ACTN|nr:hypothetical protein [Streptomyces longwoodensis]KUN40372.1 hypothetical protein AQJ30_06855 [Streptomyces longwoodensis]